jgi:hypothetical protein
MPKTTYFPEGEGGKYSAISITWTPSTQRISLSGYYDGCVGIGGTNLSLIEFLEKIGVKSKDVAKALKSMKG